jgi:hypothetical protein
MVYILLGCRMQADIGRDIRRDMLVACTYPGNVLKNRKKVNMSSVDWHVPDYGCIFINALNIGFATSRA